MREKILEANNVSISFRTNVGTVKAVRNVSFDLYKGETLAIVGESGSGKSVTARAIIGITAKNGIHESGKIMYEGQDLMQIEEQDFHKLRGNKISMIFQDPMSSLNPIKKIGYQISEAMVLKNGMSKSDAKRESIAIMEEVGIPEAANRFYQYPFQFSGGMRQRVVIAIALATNPEILICDEPTTALDVSVQAQILELINKLKTERGLSIIFITHDLGVVANMADRIAVMYAGKIVEMGEVNEIFYNPKHPYSWALLSSMPDLDSSEKLFAIPGTPPDMHFPPEGDAFAARNIFALNLDFRVQPPLFKVSDTHYAATWLLHEKAPKVEMPNILKTRIEKMTQKGGATNE